MIRCIPVDGSAPFEVEDSWAPFDENTKHHARVYAVAQAENGGQRMIVNGVACRIESWRERAERLEKEIEALRRQNALDAIDKRRESEHG